MTNSEVILLIKVVIWPAFAFILVLLLRSSVIRLLSAVGKRLDSGAELCSPWITLGSVPSNLKSPEENAPVTDNHLALIHSSWRYPQKDNEYKKPMYIFHVVIQATDEVLDRIESVRYSLHTSYPNPIQVITDRKSRFKLKELAWGESTVRAEVNIKGQEQSIMLNRYINLTQTGPRI